MTDDATTVDEVTASSRLDLDSWSLRLIRPFVEQVARLRTTVHTKLLAGFMIIALLLLSLGVLSIVVINRMNAQVDRLGVLQQQTDLSRQGLYSVTAQSHYRAMALITGLDTWNDKVATAKANFTGILAGIEAIGGAQQRAAVQRLRDIDIRFADSGEEVLSAHEAGDVDQALELHISAEHEISHELESELTALIASSQQEFAQQTAAFKADRRFLAITVAVFSAVSLITALVFGAILSWSLITPVQKMDIALAGLADGDFDQRVDVPNRDEFGRLTLNLNRTSSRLATLYKDLRSLNENLERTIEEQLIQIRRSERLRRYVAPQVADAVLSAGGQVVLTSTRKNLTILVSDIRGFTVMSERMEPEELVDALNEYLTVMTDIVFRHGGTLDKYLGDGLLAFFGDPIEFSDHAERAVATALEMHWRVGELRERWMLRYEEDLSIGIGISTGYVTVGNIGSDTRSEYTVIGNHVNLASRLANSAAPDQILVTERTMAAVKEQVEGTWVEDIHLKGVQRPMRVFSLVLPAVSVES